MGRCSFRIAPPLALCLCAACVQPAAAATLDDVVVSNHVEAALATDPRVVPGDVDVATFDGIVTLSGAVDNLTARRYAALEARKIEGVRGVINALTLKVDTRPDADLARDIDRRIVDGAVAAPSAIRVTVHHGAATLSGSVTSAAARDQALLLAGEVRGVRSVADDLQARDLRHRPDAAVENDVVAALGRDVYLASFPLTAATHAGRVTLAGNVSSEYEREQAGADARQVANVVAVANEIRVGPARRLSWSETGVRRRDPQPPDDALVGAVTDELWRDARVESPFSIAVTASAGTVTLRGAVTSVEQRDRATGAAWGVVGVQEVHNLLVVRPRAAANREVPRQS